LSNQTPETGTVVDDAELPDATICDTGDGSYVLQIDLQPEQPWFAGHFPQQGVLAGVIQVHWAMSFARQLELWGDGMPELGRVKFKSVVLPPAVIELSLVRKTDGFRFRFTSGDMLHSEGNVRFREVC